MRLNFFRGARRTREKKPSIRLPFDAGHFYSPIVDPSYVSTCEDVLWPKQPSEVHGIDFREDTQKNILTDCFTGIIDAYDYSEEPDSNDEAVFFDGNSQFSGMDPRLLFVLLQAWKVRRVIEVGSGYSSLLMADVNTRFLAGSCEITCIEPYPRSFLKNGLKGIKQVIERKVQDVPLSFFDRLESGDILFIDSSHVAKTGSDVNYLYFEVLPRLKCGVRVHVHDIFLPAEYPKDWVINENRSWNEQYLLRALLMYSTAFKVLFGSNYASIFFPELARKAMNAADNRLIQGGSFWIERV